MGRVTKKKIKFIASTSEDVAAHRIYVAPAPDELTYASPMVELLMPDVEVIVPDEFPGFPLRDVMYKIGVTAIDDIGNESDMVILDAPFDFSAPDAPTGVEVVDV